jgi:hypothetical protein
MKRITVAELQALKAEEIPVIAGTKLPKILHQVSSRHIILSLEAIVGQAILRALSTELESDNPAALFREAARKLGRAVSRLSTCSLAR